MIIGSSGDLKSCNQVFIVDGKCDFSKPSIFEQLAKINKLKYRKIKKYNKFKNKSGAIKWFLLGKNGKLF